MNTSLSSWNLSEVERAVEHVAGPRTGYNLLQVMIQSVSRELGRTTSTLGAQVVPSPLPQELGTL